MTDVPSAVQTQAGVPVEFFWPENPTVPQRIQEFAGYDLRFVPSERHRNADGTPRRIEWILDPVIVSELTGPRFNPPGRPRVFVVAQDLIAGRHDELFREQVLRAVTTYFVPRAEFEALARQVVELRELAAPRRRPRKSDEPGDDGLAEA